MTEQTLACIQVVGYKNSGKTTLVADLVTAFRDENIEVATLKHHGHGGKPEEPKETDSTRHLQAGAVVAGVEGEGTFQLSMPDTSIDTILDMYRIIPHDLLLIEGYKTLDFPKAVLIREKEDIDLISQLTNVQLVIVWDKQWKAATDFPVFSINEKQAYINFIKQMAIGGKA